MIRIVLIDAIALLIATIGFHLAFRQRFLRRLWQQDSAPDDDPAHYALIIAGVMLSAFGVLIFGFTTMFALAS